MLFAVFENAELSYGHISTYSFVSCLFLYHRVIAVSRIVLDVKFCIYGRKGSPIWTIHIYILSLFIGPTVFTGMLPVEGETLGTR